MTRGFTEEQTRDHLRKRALRAFPQLGRCDEVRDYWVGSAGVVDRLRVVGSRRDASGEVRRVVEVSVPTVGTPSLVLDLSDAHDRPAAVRVRRAQAQQFVGAGAARETVRADTSPEQETSY